MLEKILRGFMHVHILHHGRFEPVWGSMIAKELAHHGYQISPGTLYPLLHKMERDGYLEATQAMRSGRPVIVYRTTNDGKALLQQARHYIAELHREVNPPDK